MEEVVKQLPNVGALLLIVTYFLTAMREQREANARMIGIFESNLAKQDSVYRDAMTKFVTSQNEVIGVLRAQTTELRQIASTSSLSHEILKRLEKSIEDSDNRTIGGKT